MGRFSTQSERLFHKYHEKVFGFFVDFLSDRELARDLTQDIFVKLLLREESLVHIEDLDGYVYQMCRNLAFDQLKKAASQKEFRARILGDQNGDQLSIIPAIHQKMNADHYQHLIDQYLSRLPDQQRLIFNLSKREGLSNKMIASQLNISPHTVRNHLYQAMKNLRSEISTSDLDMLIALPAILWLF